jgi:hypothetical protein
LEEGGRGKRKYREKSEGERKRDDMRGERKKRNKWSSFTFVVSFSYLAD